MIIGTVVDLRVLVGVTFRLPNQPDLIIECVVDTGFEGAPAPIRDHKRASPIVPVMV